jgi:hypothetical protein
MIQVRRVERVVFPALVFQYNKLRQTVAKAASLFHADVTSLGTTGDPMDPTGAGPTAATITSGLPANASDLPTCQTLANALQTLLATHAADSVVTGTSGAGAHLIADATNAPTLAAIPVASNLATTQTLATGIKAFLNAHYTQAGVHVNNDGTNTIATANATDLATSIALLNACKTAVTAHIGSAPAGFSIALTAA